MTRPIAKDSDYLYATGRIRVLEGSLLNSERAGRILAAPSFQEALTVVAECGYALPPGTALDTLPPLLSEGFAKHLREVETMVPSPHLTDFFRIPYDYRTLKRLLKSRLAGVSSLQGVHPAGRVSLRVWEELRGSGDSLHLPEAFRRNLQEAEALFHRTRDPRLMETAADRMALREMSQSAALSGIPVLEAYGRLLIDCHNLKVLVRLHRLSAPEATTSYLVEGGSVSPETLLGRAQAGRLPELFTGSPLRPAVEAAVKLLDGSGARASLDRLCDIAQEGFWEVLRYAAYGPSVPAAYLFARGQEQKALWSLMAGKAWGVPGNPLREGMGDRHA